MNIEFVSYDGSYPTLCSGTLVIKVNGKEIALNHVMVSGGGCFYNDDDVDLAPWGINLEKYPELMPYKEEITECVNSNVPYGCCGGCI